MSSPLAVAPLVPRANKTKKKRPGFRPVGKSSKSINNSKSSSKSTGALAKESSTLKTPQDESQDDLQDRLDVQDSNAAEKVSNELSAPKQPAKSTGSTSKTTAPKSSIARKRKQSTSISVGFRSGTKLGSSDLEATPGNKRRNISAPSESSSITLDVPKITDVVEPTATRVTRSSTRPSTALVVANFSALALPEASTQDKETLERLASEDSAVSRLTAFCSSFKGAKKPRRRKGQVSKATQSGKASSSSTRNKQNQNPNTSTSSISNHQSIGSKRNASDALGAPVVQIVDGEIVLQESSLVVPGQRRTVQEVEEEFQDVVEEDAQLAIVGASYNSFVNRKGPQHWTVGETKRFFEALRQLGTDFCSMEAYFQNRNRKQLKSKYRAELIRNPDLVELALHPKNKTKVDMSIFNVEVDPKAIEAAANEEPPPYIPTNVEEQALPAAETTNATAATQDDKTAPVTAAAVATAAAIAASSSRGDETNWKEVVVEADEEEREKTAKPAKATKATAGRTRADSSSIWPGTHDDETKDANKEDDIQFPEPSMDDFFHEQEEIVDPGMLEGASMEIQVDKEDAADVITKAALPATATNKVAAPAISLVPTKAGKSKKPKFRSRSRKKK